MYTVPLYEDLVAGVMKCVAVEIFYQTQRRLHPNLRRTLQLILFPSSSAPANQSGPVPPILTGSAPSGSPLQSPAATATASAAGTTATLALRDVNVSAWRPSGPSGAPTGQNQNNILHHACKQQNILELHENNATDFPSPRFEEPGLDSDPEPEPDLNTWAALSPHCETNPPTGPGPARSSGTCRPWMHRHNKTSLIQTAEMKWNLITWPIICIDYQPASLCRQLIILFILFSSMENKI